MPAHRPRMFHELAPYYDALIAGKDTAAECRYLEALVGRYGRSPGRAWLDVACGTGRHLAILRRKFRVVGLDRSAEMLRVARRRLPGVRLVRGDMRSFDLGERFDVVSCLFSAIGHLATERELLRTFRTLASHLHPGGILLVEPWIDPEQFHPGFVHLATSRAPPLTVARLSYSRTRGRRSKVEYHYLIGIAGRGIRHVTETDVGLLVPRARLLEMCARAGLKARFLRRGLTPGRGLLVGQKPARGLRGRAKPGARRIVRTPPRTARRPRSRPMSEAPGRSSARPRRFSGDRSDRRP